MDQPALFEEPITVHCFFCLFALQDFDAQRAHDRMEEHYQARHKVQVRRILNG